MTANMWNVVFWVVMTCGPVGSNQSFRETHRLHLQEGSYFYPEDGCDMYSETMVTTYKTTRCQNPEDTIHVS
jgi:hypothetical protein